MNTDQRVCCAEQVAALLYKGYVPSFAAAFDGFLIHTGAAVVPPTLCARDLMI